MINRDVLPLILVGLTLCAFFMGMSVCKLLEGIGTTFTAVAAISSSLATGYILFQLIRYVRKNDAKGS